MPSHLRAATVLVILLGALGPTLGRAQTSTAEQADSLFQAQAWIQAEDAYTTLARQDTANAQAWYRLGYARYMQEKFEEAAQAWERSAQIGFVPMLAYYNAASAYARLGRNDDALAMLEQAAQAGFQQVQQLDTDTDLDPLRTDERFAALRAVVDKNARPCHYDGRYRQFDFWIGTWDVFNPQGQQAGTNTITLILNGCVLQENWTDSRGGAGKSFNYFDPETDQWKQLWINASGGHTFYSGSFSDGAMRFEGTVVAQDGSTKLSRMTFTPLDDGRVRQYIEQSDDGGTTWNTGFDGYYVRVTETDS